ncbi:MAG TPA: DUF72 domain-containing protein [Polyangiaceae bacterium]|nr:DUF72 domain-containing protein [Polyangiaceae bacterium]
MKAYVGTSGFSYPGWKGIFYPPRLKNADMLGYYASRLASVELNNSFYRLPTEAAFAGWAAQVPAGFRFAVKAPQRITHHKRFVEVTEPMVEFHSRAAHLGDALGPLLFQLPPNFRADWARLDHFLESTHQLPGARCAVEFRHASWFVEDTYARLREHGVALVGGDLDEADRDPPLVRTADFAYLRLRRPAYEDADLVAWARKMSDLGVAELHVYFKHEDQGPSYSEKLLAQLG